MSDSSRTDVEPLTPTLKAALGHLRRANGPLHCWPGGRWTTQQIPAGQHHQAPEWFIGTHSVRELLRRGLITAEVPRAEFARQHFRLATPAAANHESSRSPFIGYLAASGKVELHSEDVARAADWHHSHIVHDLDAYSDAGTITFVRMDSEPDFTLGGEPMLDPHHATSRRQLRTLAQLLLDAGAPPSACFKVDNFELPHAQAPFQGKNLGSLEGWAQQLAPAPPVARRPRP